MQKTYLSQSFRSIFFASTLSMVVQYLVVISDKIIAGQMLGERGVTAVMLIEPFVSVIVFLVYLVSDGSDLLVTYAKSQGDEEEASGYFSQAIWLSILLGLGLTIVYFIFGNQIVGLVYTNQGDPGYGMEYFRFLIWLPIPRILSASLYSIALYQGGNVHCNAYSAIVVISNIIMSVLGCRYWGLQGISLATLAAELMGLIPLLLFFYGSAKGKMELQWKLQWSRVLKLFRISFSKSSIYIFLPAFEFVMNYQLLKTYGQSQVLVFGAVMNILILFSALYEGLTNFVDANVNVYRGENNYVGIHRTLSFANRICILEGSVVGLLFFLMAKPFVSAMGISDPVVLAESVSAARLMSICAILFCLLDVYRNYYVDMGVHWVGLLVNALRFFPFPVMIFGFAKWVDRQQFWVWFMISEWISIAIILLIIWLSFRKDGRFPYVFPLFKEKFQRVFDVKLETASVMDMIYRIDQYLKKLGIEAKARNKVSLAIEESTMQLIENLKNTQRHGDYILQCFIDTEDQIRVILRDTSVLYNASDADQKITGKNVYAATLILDGMCENRYSIIQGNNRTIFYITRY